jgi:hypothetical protein
VRVTAFSYGWKTIPSQPPHNSKSRPLTAGLGADRHTVEPFFKATKLIS